jgi:hypothetical protein
MRRENSELLGTWLAVRTVMRTVLALLLVTAACAGRPHNKPAIGPVIGQSTAPGPSDPTAPIADDPTDIVEGGGRLSGPVGSAPGSVTPTVGEQPSTIDQAKSGNTAGTPDQGPATVYAPSVGGAVPITTVPRPTTPTTPTTPAPTTPAPTGAPVPPTTGPVTGAGPNGPGTGTGPATPTGPATGTNTPTPSTPNRR